MLRHTKTKCLSPADFGRTQKKRVVAKINGNKRSKDRPESLRVKIWGKRDVERDPGER